MALTRVRAVQAAVGFLALTLAGFAVPGSPLNPVAAQAGGCADIRDRAVHVDASERTTMKWARMDRNHQVTYTETKTIRGPVNLGRMTLTLELCKSGGKWSIRKVDVSQPHNDLTLTVTGGRVTKIKPADGSTGYAIYHERTTRSAVQLTTHRCTPEPEKFTKAARKTLSGVASLPLPGSYVISAGVWAADVALPDAPPDKYNCGRMGGTVSIDLRLNRGAPRLKWPMSGHVLVNVRDSWEQPCGGNYYIYCREIWDQTVTLSP